MAKTRKLGNKFHTAKITINKKSVSFDFPKSILKNLNGGNYDQLFWVPINDTIQIFGGQSISIPALILDHKTFKGQYG